MMKEESFRFYKIVKGQGINESVTIMDKENSEPVCILFSGYHPYVPELMWKALKQREKGGESGNNKDR